ncbi:MAG: family 43 glycosylhydrolase [Niabella sp.]
MMQSCYMIKKRCEVAIRNPWFYFLVVVVMFASCSHKDRDSLSGGLPEITSVLPETGWAGDTVTIKGAGFTDQSVVMLNGSAFSVIDRTANQIRIVMPVGTGTSNIRVINGNTRSNNMIFTYSGPLIRSLSNTLGWAGDTVTITAKALADTTYLLYDGKQTGILDRTTDSTFRFIVPAGTGTATIVIGNGNVLSNEMKFTYNTYTNPVFKPILADPTVFKDPVSGYFYAYGTENEWSTDGKRHIVAIVKSTDLVHWEYVADAFTPASKPSWRTGANIWAPDIAYVNGKYHLYYAYSFWDDPDASIGLAIADKPEGPFVDQGKLFSSSDINVQNSIDPCFYEDGGKKYLFWGSFRNNKGTATRYGTFVTELTDNGKAVKDLSNITKIAGEDFEAPMIYKHGGYYWFFGSKGTCCDGANSGYNVRVGRGTSVTGPFYGQAGADIVALDKGTFALQRTDVFAGPGHNSTIITDKLGQNWILYHALDVKNAVINGVQQRALMLDKVNWDPGTGWPVINNGYPSSTPQPSPRF